MYCSTVTQKGQITIPVHFRNSLGIKEDDKVEFIASSKGITLVPFKKKSILGRVIN
ncbi:MAG: AbrB/MazE/SpoVT family DNA-binding domain-containing protein [Proteobacteria bacterium]|nr:AbrB/MazE/SpoVT family DNA-binding domain-containing protein [Pseudomonadota bacterium]